MQLEASSEHELFEQNRSILLCDVENHVDHEAEEWAAEVAAAAGCRCWVRSSVWTVIVVAKAFRQYREAGYCIESAVSCILHADASKLLSTYHDSQLTAYSTMLTHCGTSDPSSR